MKKLFFIVALSFQSLLAQDSPHGKLTLPCETCHSTDTWAQRTDAAFNHNSTGFALTGKHLIGACRSCHKDLVFAGQSRDCRSCHTDVHQSELGSECLRCHATDSWVIADMRQKHQQTRFPLVGKHGVAACSECHERESPYRFAGTPAECIGCHRAQYQATTSPNHAEVGFAVDCRRCHRIEAPTFSSGFDHNLTAFPLTGAHRSVLCPQCHVNNQFRLISTDCYSCHAADFAGAQSPDHALGAFSHDCRSCHTTAGWTPSAFSHAATGFPLTGRHQAAQCQQCHTSGNYQLVYADCYQCHQADYQRPTDPNHVAGGFAHDCTACHTTTGWSPSTFSHSTTKFALTGTHTTTPCQSCHTGGNYGLAYTGCVQCHLGNYQQSTNPNHVSGSFSQVCDRCHSTTLWRPALFDHTVTRFPLTGMHAASQCQQCHINGNYQLAYTGCVQCHLTDYQQSTNPNHVSGNFSQVCDRCHSTTLWRPASFDHAVTRFPLTGSHVATPCLSCHVNSNYQLLYTDCYACHAADYQRPTDPNHVTGGFAHDCTPCHTTTSWSPSTFSHGTTKFPLTGAHTTTPCQSCHTSGNYQLVYTDCYQCHQADYQRPTDPNHVLANFGHDCTPCHTTTAWSPSTFNHDGPYFKIYSGAHQGKWTVCADCHKNPADYTQYTCTSCHTQADMDPAHSAVSGYVYSTPACYNCHKGV